MSGLSFGIPQTTVQSTMPTFGAIGTQQAPAQQPVASLTFGTPAAAPTIAAAPVTLQPAPTTASGLTFGLSAPPYGAQTTTATPSLTFGLGTATSRYNINQSIFN